MIKNTLLFMFGQFPVAAIKYSMVFQKFFVIESQYLLPSLLNSLFTKRLLDKPCSRLTQ